MQLQSKILLLLIPLIVLPILVLGAASYNLFMEDARDRTRFQMTALLKQIEAHTESQLRTARANASLFASTDLIKRYTQPGLSAVEQTVLEPVIQEMLFNYQMAYPEYYEIRIVTEDGREQLRSVLGGTPNLTTDESGTDYFIDVKNHADIIYTAFIKNPDNGKPALLVSKPLPPATGKENSQESARPGYCLLYTSPSPRDL